MKRALFAFAVAAGLRAQVIELPAMTVTHSSISMSAVLPASNSATVTNLTALINAGTDGGAPLTAAVLTPSTAAAGLYNTNTQLGRALAMNAAGALLLIQPATDDPATVPPAAFSAFNARFDLSVRGTQFGIAIGDWLGSMVLEFRDAATNTLLASYTTTPFTTAGPKFFRSSVPFDRVVVRADSPDGNWVIPQLHFETPVSWTAFGAGCAGSNGIPTLNVVTQPRLNQTFQLSVTNMPSTGGTFVMILGLSTTTSSLGPLPFPLDSLGAPGCLLYCDVFGYNVLSHTSGTGSYSQPIPNNQAYIGVQIANQAVVVDPTVNLAGLVMSNAGVGTIR